MRKLGVLVVVALLALGAACGGDDDDSASGAGGFCAAQAKNVDALGQQQSSFNQESLKAMYERLDDSLDDAVEAAPSEIKADVQTIAGAFKPFVAELRKVDFDFLRFVLSNPQSPVLQRLQAPEVTQATQRVSAYYQEHCE